MTTRKISEITTRVTALASNDRFEVSQNLSTTPVTKYATPDDIAAYGPIKVAKVTGIQPADVEGTGELLIAAPGSDKLVRIIEAVFYVPPIGSTQVVGSREIDISYAGSASLSTLATTFGAYNATDTDGAILLVSLASELSYTPSDIINTEIRIARTAANWDTYGPPNWGTAGLTVIAHYTIADLS
jgi:hypothetical protein